MARPGRDLAPGVAGDLAVRLLGPLELVVGGRPVAVSAPRLRTMLAVLAVQAGRTVSVDRLATAAWGEELPGDPRRAVQTYMARLRRLLGGERIGTSPDGYLLCVESDRVDALRFERLLDQAAVAPDAAGERALLAEALSLWRGVPFEDVRSASLAEGEARWLTERYLAAVERRVDLDLAGGRAIELVAELSGLVARWPLRESLWVRLLVVLDRCGRQAEALERYEAVRVRLAEELGADPGPELQRVHADLLAVRRPQPAPTPARAAVRPTTHNPAPPQPERARDAPRVTARQVVPRQLPAEVDGFTGREQELAGLQKLLDVGDDGTSSPVVVSAVAGKPGIGKSALVVHAAHRVAGQFPDGQLYVNLHGATPGLRPLDSLEVLGRFLRALGMDRDAIPSEVEEAAALFRSQVAGRRLLVVLDDAADAAQVRPLLPGVGCRVLVTSRRVLASLEGAHHLYLDVLPPEEAVELLGRLAGEERVAAEPDAAAEVARLCGQLPLALRIAGARLAARPAWPVRALAERLADAQHRLDELELGDLGVRASFTISSQQLHANGDATDRAAAATFGLLGVLNGPEVGVPVAARLLNIPEQAAERVLERLADAQLLETPAPGRYRLHDLLRLYARELAGRDHPEAERAAALTRALGFYVASAWRTLELLRPGDHRLARADQRWRTGGQELADDRAALAWLDAERANLLTAVQQAATAPGVPSELAIQLAHALYAFFVVRFHLQDWVRINRTAVSVARRAGNVVAEAQAHNDLGSAYMLRGQYERALASHQDSLALRRKLGDRRGEAESLSNLGNVHVMQGRLKPALAREEESVALYRELGDRRGEATGLTNLGNVHIHLGRYADALACHEESLTLARQLGDRHGQAITLDNLGNACQRLGRYEQALTCYQQSLTHYQELGDCGGQAYCLHDLGVVYQRLGRYEQALTCQQESLAIHRDLGVPHGQADSLRELGVTLQALGRPEEARAHWQEALAIFEQLHTPEADQVRALLTAADSANPAEWSAMKAM